MRLDRCMDGLYLYNLITIEQTNYLTSVTNFEKAKTTNVFHEYIAELIDLTKFTDIFGDKMVIRWFACSYTTNQQHQGLTGRDHHDQTVMVFLAHLFNPFLSTVCWSLTIWHMQK